MILVTPLLVGRPDILTWKEAIEPQLEMARLIGFARSTVATPEDPDLRAEFRAVQLLTFTVISRCCSPGVQIALKSCKEHLDVGHWAWHFIESTYEVTDELFIGQLKGQLTHLRMGDQETATNYCNKAQRILATIRMAGAQYSSASYVTHVMQGLRSNYNLLKRLPMAPSTRASLNEDTLTLPREVWQSSSPSRRKQATQGEAVDQVVTTAGDVLGRASYDGRVLCTDLRPWSVKSTTPTTEVVALWAIVSKREKARLFVKSFTQVYGADYDETYAPVSSYVTLRIFLSIVAVLDLNLMQLDMKNAFLQSKLDRVLYMYQPDYFNDGTGRVCKLLKSLYGLKQSPLLWYKALNDVLIGAGWKKSQVDTALYFKVGASKVAGLRRRPARRQQHHRDAEGAEEAAGGRLRAARDLACAEVPRAGDRPRQTVCTLKTPVSIDAYVELTFDNEEAQERQEEEYRQKFGSLQFAATTTRPDITFACSMLGSGLTVRSDQHWLKVDHCLTYLTNTCDTALEFGGGADSLSWSATTPTNLWVENKSAITVAEGMGLTGNLKHMERRQAWLQHMVKRGKFSLRHIPTAEQPADFLTKALHYPAFKRCSVAIGQVRLVDVGDGDNDVQQ
ncbi:unnamed protein product [Closterium sp. NIES-53]